MNFLQQQEMQSAKYMGITKHRTAQCLLEKVFLFLPECIKISYHVLARPACD